MYQRILAANDGSLGAQKALTAAVAMARRDGAELHMTTVEELPRFPASIDEVEEEETEARQRLAPIIAAARAEAEAASVNFQAHVVPGHVVEAIVGLVNDWHIDLLVVGFMGHSALYERIIGSPRPIGTVHGDGRQISG